MEAAQEKSATSTSVACLATYSPKEVAAAFREVTTAAEALAVARSGRVASLGMLGRTLGPSKVAALMKLYLIELNEVIGLKTPMSEKQIDAAAEEILAKYPYLNMADINLVFRRIKCGEYGKLYDRLPMPQLMQFFSAYNDERCDEAARLSRQEAEMYKEAADRPRSSEKDMASWKNALRSNFMKNLKTH